MKSIFANCSTPSHRSARATITAAILSATMLAGCATPPPADDPEAKAEWEQTNDPIEPFNRSVFDFNHALDKAVFKPVAQGYRDYVPQYARDRVRDVIHNLSSPLIFANDILQGEPDRAVQTVMRFTFNSSFGVLGLFDIAGEGGIPYHTEDLGQTFAVWGVGDGPYLVLPIFGPSNPRDTVGMIGEYLADPVSIGISNAGLGWVNTSRGILSGVNKREENLDGLDDVERNSIDLYSAIRSLYRQHRASEIKNKTDTVTSPGFVALPSPQISQENN